MKMSPVKQITITAACIALCYVLPMVFHATGLGSILSPMHIPVFLCGLICGGLNGLICGIAGPLLSSVLSGMPTATGLIFMVPELAVYGLVSGLAMKLIRTGKLFGDLYASMLIAMVLGRVAGGVASAFFYMGSGEAFTLSVWVSSYFLGTLPGIICQLILIPLLIAVLVRARLIPSRYPQATV